MKLFTYILSLVALGFVIYNFTKVNFEAPFKEESITALITIFAGLCAIILLSIVRVSKTIEQRKKLSKKH